MEAAEELGKEVGVRQACEALSVPRASLYRRRQASSSSVSRADPRRPSRALNPQERQQVKDELYSERHRDSSPREVYATLLGKMMKNHGANVYLVNTGWSGGAYGEGSRMDITLTRSIVEAALNGSLENVEYSYEPLFHISVPKECPGVPSDVLTPKNTWKDKKAYDARAKKLASDFAEKFDKAYGDKGIDPAIAAQCPGR